MMVYNGLMKRIVALLVGVLLTLSVSAQWIKTRGGALNYHCAACTGVADFSVTRTTLAMEGIVDGDITVYDSLSHVLVEWKGVEFNSDVDSVVAVQLYRFINRREGFVEMLLYRPTAWSPRQMECFTYIIPTVRREKIESRWLL